MSGATTGELSDTVATLIAQAGNSEALAQRIAEIILPTIARYIAVAEDERIAYDIKTFAKLVCLGETTIDEAAKRGDLIRRYPTPAGGKPLIAREDGLNWIRTLPTERPEK